MQSETIKVKFDGQSHQVDVHTFMNVVMDYSRVLQDAADSAGIEEKVSINITATEAGSLDVLLSIVAEQGQNLLSFIASNKEPIEGVVILAAGLYKFKQKIAGKKSIKKISEDESDEVTIDADGESMQVSRPVYNFYVNFPQASEAINNTFAVLAENPSVEGLQMSANDELLFRAEQDEFAAIAESPNYEGEDVRHVEEFVTLQVIKPYLAASKTRRWEFLYNGTKITAPILDEDFLNKIDEVTFRVGMQFKAKLDIKQEYIPKYKAWMNKSYTIQKVEDVELPIEPEQLSFE